MIGLFLDAHVMGALAEGLQGQAGEELVEKCICVFPDGLSDAFTLEGTFGLAFAFLGGCTGAVHQQYILLGGVEDIKHGNLVEAFGETVATFWATLAFENSGSFKVLKNLFEIAWRNLLPP